MLANISKEDCDEYVAFIAQNSIDVEMVEDD